MGKDYTITIKDGGGLASQQGRRGPLSSVPGNPNVDRRRLVQPVAPFFLWDGGIGNLTSSAYSLTIWFPYSQNVGGPRGPWWRKENDLFILAYWSETTATLTGGTWTDVPGSPFTFNGGTMRIVWSRWTEGNDESFTVTGTGKINGIIHAFRNVSDSYVFTDATAATGIGTPISAPSLNLAKNSGYFAITAVPPLPTAPPDNIISASSNKLDYLARYWDFPQDFTVNIGTVLGIAKEGGAIDDLSISTSQSSDSFVWATELPAEQVTRPITKAMITAAYYESYFPTGLGSREDLRIGDVVGRLFSEGQDMSEYNGWTFKRVADDFKDAPVFLATKRIETLANPLPLIDFVLTNASANLDLLSSAQGTGLAAISSAGARPVGELILTVGLASASFSPQPSASGLDEFCTDNGIVARSVTSGYSNGGEVSVTMPLSNTAEWISINLKAKRR
jgi:hypothetical protein